MLSCADCSELLLDHLYDLLDEQEAQQVREHLTGCMACQEQLVVAKKQQELLSLAARKYREVPAFTLPADEVAQVAPQVAAAPPPIKLPMPTARTIVWPRWLALGAAAAVLVAICSGYVAYQRGLQDRLHTLAAVRQQIESIDAKMLTLAQNEKREEANLDKDVQKQFLQTQVLGPATVQAGVANNYSLTTKNPLGQLAPAQVEVKLLNRLPGQETDEVQYKKKLDNTAGNLQMVLPPLTAVQLAANPRLVIETSNG